MKLISWAMGQNNTAKKLQGDCTFVNRDAELMEINCATKLTIIIEELWTNENSGNKNYLLLFLVKLFNTLTTVNRGSGAKDLGVFVHVHVGVFISCIHHCVLNFNIYFIEQFLFQIFPFWSCYEVASNGEALLVILRVLIIKKNWLINNLVHISSWKIK